MLPITGCGGWFGTSTLFSSSQAAMRWPQLLRRETCSSGRSVLGESAAPGEPELPVLQLERVGLSIPVYSTETRQLKRVLIRSVTGGALSRDQQGAVVEALRDVTCNIYHGERVGLIGHNGAGKTTFLRLVSGIYTPTSGRFQCRCKVSPMLQKSFITSPDLSGYLAVKAHYLLTHGSLAGFDAFLEDILEFSGLGDYLHLPMKGYSEGMRSRLMFALITGSAHECLALDEGFGTGDTRFYKRARLRMQSFVESTGTLILASHSEGLLRKFCTRGLVFDQGKIVYDAPLEDALAYYDEACS